VQIPGTKKAARLLLFVAGLAAGIAGLLLTFVVVVFAYFRAEGSFAVYGIRVDQVWWPISGVVVLAIGVGSIRVGIRALRSSLPPSKRWGG
jgi:membrane protease YdiL (CAAX protease family)